MDALTKEEQKEIEEKESNLSQRQACLKVTKLFLKLTMVTSFIMAFVVKDSNMKNVLAGAALLCAFGGLGTRMALDIEEQKYEKLQNEKSQVSKSDNNVREK